MFQNVFQNGLRSLFGLFVRVSGYGFRVLVRQLVKWEAKPFFGYYHFKLLLLLLLLVAAEQSKLLFN